MPAWKQHPDLMRRLVQAQNHPANIGRDVVTFAGLCDSREELERHVLACEDTVATFQRVRAA